MTGKKYTIALIGAGRMGERWAKVIAESLSLSLALVVDTERRQADRVAKEYRTRSSTDHTEAFGSEIDAVLVAVPHRFLYPLAHEALLAGKHVFVEKPGSRTAREMRDLIGLARDKNRALMVGFNYRFFDSVRQAKRIVAGGKIGQVLSVRLVHGHLGRGGYEKEWRMQKDLAGGGVLMDQGLHLIDLARWFLEDRVVKVRGVVSNRRLKTEVEDMALVLLKTAEGKVASLSVSVSEQQDIFSLDIVGEKGSLSIPGLGRKYGNGASFSLWSSGKERVVACDPDADKALALELREFSTALSRKKQTSLNAEDALAVLKIIEKIYAEK